MPVPPLPFALPSALPSALPAPPATPHLILPYAALEQAACQQALATLALPHLDQLLRQLSPATADTGDEHSPLPPHERAAAQALGLAADAQGNRPWAAWQAACQGLEGAATAPWAFLTPCHWTVGADQARLDNPADLQLDEADARALFDLLAPWFAQDGFTLVYDQPARWLVHGPALQGLACASLDRVLLRDVAQWLPDAAAARTLHRLHSEVQMLLYTHVFNDRRAERGLPPVNAFWLHGTGALQDGAPPVPAGLAVDARLRTPALRSDWNAWSQAWQALDAGPLAALAAHVGRGGRATLTLCGERQARSFTTAPRSLWQKIQGVFSPQRFMDLQKSL